MTVRSSGRRSTADLLDCAKDRGLHLVVLKVDDRYSTSRLDSMLSSGLLKQTQLTQRLVSPKESACICLFVCVTLIYLSRRTTQ